MLISIISIFFFTTLLTAGFMILLLPNPIHSLLFLVIIFVNSAGILLAFNVEFISLLLIIIYVGAIAILFLFMLMMMDIKIASTLKTDWFVYIFFCILLSSSLLFEIYFGVSTFMFSSLNNSIINNNLWINLITEFNNCETFGHTLYSYYLFFFLTAGLILLVALIGAVLLTHTPNKLNEKDFHQISKQASIYTIE